MAPTMRDTAPPSSTASVPMPVSAELSTTDTGSPIDPSLSPLLTATNDPDLTASPEPMTSAQPQDVVKQEMLGRITGLENQLAKERADNDNLRCTVQDLISRMNHLDRQLCELRSVQHFQFIDPRDQADESSNQFSPRFAAELKAAEKRQEKLQTDTHQAIKAAKNDFLNTVELYKLERECAREALNVQAATELKDIREARRVTIDEITRDKAILAELKGLAINNIRAAQQDALDAISRARAEGMETAKQSFQDEVENGTHAFSGRSNMRVG